MIARRSFLSQAGLLALAGAGAWALRDRVLWPSPARRFAAGETSSGWLPISRDLPIAAVEAQVNGTGVRVLVDSGAQISVVDRQLAERLGLDAVFSAPVVAFGLSGRPQIGRSADMEVRLGALTLPKLRAAILDLGPLAQADGDGVGLVLGLDLLRGVALDLDLPARRLAFHAAASPPVLDGGVSTPVRLIGRELYAPITVEGRALEVVLDTGFSEVLALSEETASSVGLFGAGGEVVEGAPSVTFGGYSRTRGVEAEAVSFAGRTFRRPSVQIYARPAGSALPSGLLGLGALRHARTLIDAGRSQLTMAPVAEAPPRRRRGRV